MAPAGDCNDRKAQVNPGKTEIAGNAADDDCDGLKDEPAATALPPELTEHRGLDLKALPNSSAGSFSLHIRSTATSPVRLRILDAAGRRVEVRSGLPPNSVVR